nr:hypothetical protein [Tanacetum cinerariifolium]
LLVTIGLAVGPTSLPVEITVAGGPAVRVKPLPVGTSVSPASTIAASIEVKTLAISSESLLILSAAASPSLVLKSTYFLLLSLEFGHQLRILPLQAGT